MCDPVSLTIAATAVTAAGSVQAGMAGRAQGNYEAKIADRNAALTRNQAADALDRGTIEQRNLARKYAQLKGSQAAAMAANGLDLGFGSSLRVQEDTAQLYGEDASTLNLNTMREVQGFDINAANYRAEGQAAKMRGKQAMTAGLFGAAGSILSGATQYSKLKSGSRG